MSIGPHSAWPHALPPLPPPTGEVRARLLPSKVCCLRTSERPATDPQPLSKKTLTRAQSLPTHKSPSPGPTRAGQPQKPLLGSRSVDESQAGDDRAGTTCPPAELPFFSLDTELGLSLRRAGGPAAGGPPRRVRPAARPAPGGPPGPLPPRPPLTPPGQLAPRGELGRPLLPLGAEEQGGVAPPGCQREPRLRPASSEVSLVSRPRHNPGLFRLRPNCLFCN